jgi:hypothetical protein
MWKIVVQEVLVIIIMYNNLYYSFITNYNTISYFFLSLNSIMLKKNDFDIYLQSLMA